MKEVSNAASLEGKVALITGATSGVGRAAALGFAGRGANVVATGRRDVLGKELEADAIVGAGDLHFVQADVRSVTDCDLAVSEAIRRFGRLDVVVCCAGVESQITDFHAMTEEDWDRVVDTNLKGTAFICRAAIPHMLNRGGVILNIASINAVGGIAHMAPYNASKAGVVQLTRTLAVEYLTAGIRANSIILGGAEGERPLTGRSSGSPATCEVTTMSMTSQRTCWPDNQHRKLRTFSHFFAQTKRSFFPAPASKLTARSPLGWHCQR